MWYLFRPVHKPLRVGVVSSAWYTSYQWLVGDADGAALVAESRFTFGRASLFSSSFRAEGACRPAWVSDRGSEACGCLTHMASLHLEKVEVRPQA